MKGFAILLAILGFCSQYANAAVVRNLTPVPEVEALGDSSRVERAETLIFNENNDAHATRTEVGNGISIDSDIIPREKAAVPTGAPTLTFPWHGNMMHFVYCIYYQQPYPYGTYTGTETVMKDLIVKAIAHCGAKYIAVELLNLKEAYIGRYTDHKFPETLRS